MRTISSVIGVALASLLASTAQAGTDYADTVYWVDTSSGEEYTGVLDDASSIDMYSQTWHPDPWTGFDGQDTVAWLVFFDCIEDDKSTFPQVVELPYTGQAAFSPENDEFLNTFTAADITIPVPSEALCADVIAWNGAEDPGDPATGTWGGDFSPTPAFLVECEDLDGNHVCDAAEGCEGDFECDDGLFCNGAETCVDGDCLAGAPPALDDGVGCTLDSCNEDTDTVDHTPDAGACSDGVDCTTDTCDPVSDCSNTPDDGACDLGPCVIGECDPAEGCVVVEDLGDADGDGVCDAEDECPLGDLGGLDFGDQVYVFRDSDGADHPASIEVGDAIGTYGQAFHEGTPAEGAQSDAEVAVGPCGALSDWMPGDYYIGEGTFAPDNDEHLAVVGILPEWEGADLCIGWRLQATGGGDCWTYSSEFPFTVEGAPCADGDGDGVCDDVDACPGFDDAADADGDGVPDGCDDCPVGDDGALEFWTFQFLSPLDDPDDAFPATLFEGVTYDAYGQFFHDFTFADGPQTVAELGIGACGDPASYDTWLPSAFNIDIFNNDEWRSTFELPDGFTSGDWCLAWRGRSDAAGDDCWAYTDEHPFTAVPAITYEVRGDGTPGTRLGIIIENVGLGGRAVLMRGSGLGEGPCIGEACMGITPPVNKVTFAPATEPNGTSYVSWRVPEEFGSPDLYFQIGVETPSGDIVFLEPFTL